MENMSSPLASEAIQSVSGDGELQELFGIVVGWTLTIVPLAAFSTGSLATLGIVDVGPLGLALAGIVLGPAVLLAGLGAAVRLIVANAAGG